MTDRQLLLTHLAGDPAAFEQLVRRHINMIYAASSRQVGPTNADDITQAVFLMLHQKAHTLRRRESLAGWLYRAASFCCANLRRTNSRRQKHEREAAVMIPQVKPNPLPELREFLDAALTKLPALDREALLLRYVQQLDYAQTAAALNISEDTARKRAERTIQKLRAHFAKQGLTLSESDLAVSAAPTTLVNATLLAIASPHNAVTPALIAKGALHMMRATKIKLAFVAAALLLLFLPAFVIFTGYNQQQATAQSMTHVVTQSQSQNVTTTTTATEEATDTASATTMNLLVVDKDSKQPLPGAAILTAGGAIPRFNGTTDDTGHIQVPLPKTDKYPYYNVAVRCPGYVFKTLRWFPNSPTMGGAVFTAFTLEMEHTATVRGTLLDENGQPIPRASVMLSFDKKFPSPHEIYDIGGSDGFVVVKTSAAGTFTYNAAPAVPDSVTIAASDSAHLTQTDQVFTPLAKLYDGSATLTLHSGGIAVDGTVLDQNDNPIPKARVYIQLTTTASGSAAQLTDQTGAFAFCFNSGDKVTLFAIAKGNATDAEKITITTSPQHLTIHLHPK